MGMSVSFKKATKKTNLKHNNRQQEEYDNKKIDKSRMKNNKYLVQDDIKKIYEREFGEALEKYNAKQKRKDRKIKNYFEHVKGSKKTAVQQELVVQVGTGYNGQDYEFGDEYWHKTNEILEEYFKEFEKRNPNLKVYNAVIHNDETSPHMHINFVPVATGYKRGLEKQVAFNKAIKQQDKRFDVSHPFEAWRENEINEIEKLMKEREIEREKPGTNEYKDTNELKKITVEREKLQREREKLQREHELYVNNMKKEVAAINNHDVSYSHLEKNLEQYEEVREVNTFGGLRKKEETVIKYREVDTGNVVMTPEQFQSVLDMSSTLNNLKSKYEHLEGLYEDERALRLESDSKHEKQLETIEKELNERAERLKDEKYKELEKVNGALRNRLIDKQRHYDVLTDDYTKIRKEKQDLEEKLDLAVEDNERLYEENSKLRDNLRKTIEYFEWRFKCLWSVTKDYLKEYTFDGIGAIKDIKDLFRFETDEEIEPKLQKKKNKEYDHDLEL